MLQKNENWNNWINEFDNKSKIAYQKKNLELRKRISDMYLSRAIKLKKHKRMLV